MADIDRLIGFMAIMQVPFMNDPDVLAYIEEVKTVLKQAKAQEPKRGKWIYHQEATWKYECPECHCFYPGEWNYCANCGANWTGE